MKYTVPFRRTRMGGITVYIAVCLQCRRVVLPTRERRSRSGTHGEDFYVHDHPLSFILLYSSNSGNRDITVSKEIEGTFPGLKEILERMWVFENAEIEDVASFLEKFLRVSGNAVQ